MWNMMSDMCGINMSPFQGFDIICWYNRPALRDVNILCPFRALVRCFQDWSLFWAASPERAFAANDGCSPSFFVPNFPSLWLPVQQSPVIPLPFSFSLLKEDL